MALSIWDDEDDGETLAALGYSNAYERLFDSGTRRAERVRMPRRERPRKRRVTVAQLRAAARANMHRRIEAQRVFVRARPVTKWAQLALFAEVAA